MADQERLTSKNSSVNSLFIAIKRCVADPGQAINPVPSSKHSELIDARTRLASVPITQLPPCEMEQRSGLYPVLLPDRKLFAASTELAALPLQKLSYCKVEQVCDGRISSPDCNSNSVPPKLVYLQTPEVPLYKVEQKLGEGYEVHRFDVLAAKDKQSQSHVGNNRFRLCVEMRVSRYRSAKTREDKTVIVKEVIDAVRTSGGRFIRRERIKPERDGAQETRNIYYDIGNRKAADKVGKALRTAQRKHSQQQRYDAESTQGAKSRLRRCF